MGYNEYLRHLKEGNCAKYKIYTCPLKCGDPDPSVKMTFKEYIDHIKHKCKNVLIECTRCSEKTERKLYRNHQARTCISHLSKTIKKTKE